MRRGNTSPRALFAFLQRRKEIYRGGRLQKIKSQWPAPQRRPPAGPVGYLPARTGGTAGPGRGRPGNRPVARSQLKQDPARQRGCRRPRGGRPVPGRRSGSPAGRAHHAERAPSYPGGAFAAPPEDGRKDLSAHASSTPGAAAVGRRAQRWRRARLLVRLRHGGQPVICLCKSPLPMATSPGGSARSADARRSHCTSASQVASTRSVSDHSDHRWRAGRTRAEKSAWRCAGRKCSRIRDGHAHDPGDPARNGPHAKDIWPEGAGEGGPGCSSRPGRSGSYAHGGRRGVDLPGLARSSHAPASTSSSSLRERQVCHAEVQVSRAARGQGPGQGFTAGPAHQRLCLSPR